LRNTASDTQPACSDSGSHCHHGWRAWRRVCEASHAAANRQPRLSQITASASQNHCRVNTTIHSEVRAKPAAVNQRMRRSRQLSSPVTSWPMPNTTSSAKIGPQIANA